MQVRWIMDLTQSALEHYGLIAALIIFCLEKVFTILKGETKRYLHEMHENTKAIAELQIHIKYLNEKLELISDIKDDLEDAKDDIRILKAMGRK